MDPPLSLWSPEGSPGPGSVSSCQTAVEKTTESRDALCPQHVKTALHRMCVSSPGPGSSPGLFLQKSASFVLLVLMRRSPRLPVPLPKHIQQILRQVFVLNVHLPGGRRPPPLRARPEPPVVSRCEQDLVGMLGSSPGSSDEEKSRLLI